MTTLYSVGILWGIFTAALIILLIYRSTLTMGKDEQLFLDDASSHMHDEQTELLKKSVGCGCQCGFSAEGRVCFSLSWWACGSFKNSAKFSNRRKSVRRPKPLF